MKFLKTILTLSLIWVFTPFLAQAQGCVEGTISIFQSDQTVLCLDGEDVGTLRFRSRPLSLPYAYLVVNEQDIIVHIGTSNFIDFTNLPTGVLRVISFSFIGPVLAEVGDNYLETALAFSCYQLVSNEITISNGQPTGGSVSTSDGQTALSICLNEGINNTINVVTDSDFSSYTYIITDENNLILGTSETGEVDFTDADLGVCHVWGLAYVGELNAPEGAPILDLELADGCFELSNNFVEVTRLFPDAGSLSYSDGSDSFVSCSELEPSGSVELNSTYNNATDFTFIMVNTEDNRVLRLFSDTNIDLSGLSSGSYQIYGLAYTGTLLAEEGGTFNIDALSNECQDVSNSIVLIKRVQHADDVTLQDGSDDITICVGDGIADELNFVSTYAGNDGFIYLITDESNFLIATSETGIIDFEGTEAGICRVWGLAYSGNLTLAIGENIGLPSLLSDECFDLSDGFVRVDRNGPVAGEITYEDGSDTFISCTELPPNGELLFNVINNDPNSDYALVVVDSANGVVKIISGPSIDIEVLEDGVYSVFGVSYIGDLGLEIDDLFLISNITATCFDITANPLVLIRRVQHADDVTLEDGSSAATVCVGDGVADELTFTSTYVGNDEFIYLITDESNFLIGTSETGIIDFEDAEAGICRVWGLAYSGDLTIAVGENIGEDIPLSNECFDLSDGFVVIDRNGPQAGTISFEDGSSSFFSCTEVPPAGTLTITVAGTDGSSNYSFIVVDENNTIALINDGSIDIANLANGNYTIYGVAYFGELGMMVGDVFDPGTSIACLVTTQGIQLVRRVQQAGDVTLADGSTEISVCIADGFPDELTFVSTYTGDDAFIFIITDENNLVIGTSETGVVDFENADPGICHLWGLAYSGNLLLEEGDDITAGQPLSDECFDLSDSFTTVNRNSPDAGTINLLDGSNNYLECNASESNVTLEFETHNVASNLAYRLLVINMATNEVVAILNTLTLDLNTLGFGTYEIYGVSYLGNLTIAVGDTFAGGVVSDLCSDFSDNTVVVTNRSINVDHVQMEGGATATSICPADGVQDFIIFESDYEGNDHLVYIITDENNVIIQFLASPTHDFDTGGEGNVRVWAVTYSGNFILTPGDTLNADTQVSDECFDRSDNFVLIARNGPEGGTVALEDGSTSIDICIGDGIPDVLSVSTTGLGASYAYLITDEDNNLLEISESGEIDFEGADPGICHIWTVAYVGDLVIMPGDNVETTLLAATGCGELSDNFITVNRTFVDGGTVSLEDGSTSSFSCAGDGVADFFVFTHESTAENATYGYIITDENEFILGFLEGNSIDLELAGPGGSHVWGISFTGEFLAFPGDNINEVVLSEGCYELSSNFITIQREQIAGGMVSLADGNTSINICPANETPDVLSFINTGVSTGIYTYILTDVDNNFLNTLPDEFDFNNIAAPDEIHIWGLAYSGLLNELAGDIQDIALSNRCYALSENFITVIRETPVGGTITGNGAANLFLCNDDGIDDLVTFEVSGASNTDYVYAIAGIDNTVFALLTNTDSFQFEGLEDDEFRIWGIAFTGMLNDVLFQNIEEAALSNDCYALSDNFITIITGELNAGTVATNTGNSEAFTCPGDGMDDIITVVNENAGTGNYAYALTNQDNVVIDITPSGEVNFETRAEGIYNIWGFIYTGDLFDTLGDTIGVATLASGCYDLSDNLVSVTNISPVAGTISVDGQTEISVCIGDGTPDLLEFDVEGASAAAYAYMIIEADSFLVGTLTDPSFDLENSAQGDWQICGISYTGSLNALPGTNIFTEPLSSGCYELTENCIFVNKTHVDGGEVYTDLGSQLVYSCPNGASDVFNFINTGSSSEADYIYVLTTQSNLILKILAADQLDLLDAAGLSELRLWGVSYTGEWLGVIGNTITETVLSDGCFVLSSSTVDIFIDNPEAGTLSLPNGETATTLCHSNSMPGVTVLSTSSSNAGYAYLLTNEMDELIDLSLSSEGFVSFDDVDPGTYHIWGLSYTGNLLVGAGDAVTVVDLATSCYELSENFITVDRTESMDAGNIFTVNSTEDILYLCPGDANSDLVILSNDSDEANFRYVITNENDAIFVADIEGEIIDFNVAPAGIYHIYGIAYTGEFDANFMEDINTGTLSTECWALTNNFITIINEAPDGGNISTADGEIEISLTVGDGIADEVTFVHTALQEGLYSYIITDEENVIIAISTSATIDFEEASPGTCRVWGVAYTGNITAAMGEDIDEVGLGDDCNDLSDNFVTVIRTSLEGRERNNDQWLAGLEMPQIQLALSPNPVNDLLMIDIVVPGEGTTANQSLKVYNMNGLLVYSMDLAPTTGEQSTSLNVSNLEDGMYLLRWFDGEHVIITRFVKQ